MRIPGRLLAACGAAILLALAAAALLRQAGPRGGRTAAVRVGDQAPDFELPGAAGGRERLSRLRGRPVLLSFVRAHASDAYEEAQGTRAELTFLLSMHRQYGGRGLRVLLVDAAPLETGRQTGRETTVNFVHDWNLPSDMPLLGGAGAVRVAGLYGVRALPATFLIGPGGVVAERWDGVALAPQMAMAVETLLGTSRRGEGGSEPAADAGQPDGAPWPTPARTILRGFGPARPLSGSIWAVDQGMNWPAGKPFPVTWIVLSGRGAPLEIVVKARHVETGAEETILRGRLAPLPRDENLAVTANLPGKRRTVHQITARMLLSIPGRYRITAEIFKGGGAILRGNARINVE